MLLNPAEWVKNAWPMLVVRVRPAPMLSDKYDVMSPTGEIHALWRHEICEMPPAHTSFEFSAGMSVK